MRPRWSLREVFAPLEVALSFLRAQAGPRLCVLGGGAVAIVALLAASGGLPGWLVLGLVLLAYAAALLPDTVVGLGFVATYGLAWLAQVERGVDRWALLAAVGLGGFHIVAAAASVVPPQGRLPRPMLHAWARRAAPVGAITGVVWLVAVVLERVDLGSNAVLTAVALAVLAAGGWALVVRSRTGDPHRSGPDRSPTT